MTPEHPYDQAHAGPSITRTKSRRGSVLATVGGVLAVGAIIGGVAVGYARGADHSDSHYAAVLATMTTPTVTTISTSIVTHTPDPVKVPVTVQRTVTYTVEPTAAAALTLTGTQDVVGADNWTKTANGCEGAGGYDDFTIGASVIVYDNQDNNAGAGSLETSHVDGNTCTFDFTINDITPGSNVYLVEVTRRGKVKAELIGGSLFYAGTIGSE